MNELDMLQEDCDLDEIVDIDIGSDGETVPEKNNKIALIDADTIAYTACLSTEVGTELLGREFYSDEEWQDIINSDGYDSKKALFYEIDATQVLQVAKDKINRILDKTGCLEAELHFSGGSKNFRYDIYPEYKANRVGTRRPTGLAQLKADLLVEFKGVIHTKWEADDAVVYYMKKDPAKYILVALDKDVLNSVEGRVFNYYESALYNKKMKWMDIDRHTTLTWRYLQTITGDKTDNIVGVKGLGPVKASKILEGCFSHRELWQAVCRAYESKGRTKDEALLNLNLVDMHLLQEVDGNLEIVLNTHEELLNDKRI